MLKINDDNRRWWILGAMSGVLGLVVLDETIVGVALATIQPELQMSQVASHWVVNAYFLTFTGFVAIGGRLGDVLGHRGFFVFGTAVFGFASLAAGFAPNGAWLIAARAIQGVGAAIVFPSCWAMMTMIFPAEERGRAFGIQTTVGGIFMATGPLIGGLFTETISWRWIFWINLPVVAAIALVVLLAWVEPTRDVGEARAKPRGAIDYRGLISLVVGLSTLVVALMQGIEWGWDSPAILILLSASAVLLIYFIVTETRIAHPLIEVGLLRNMTFAGGNLAFFTFQFNKIAVFVFVALFLQTVLHKTPIVAGLAVLIAVLPTLVTSLIAGKSTDRYGSRGPLAIGLLLNGTALVCVGFATAADSYVLIVAPLVVWGATLPFASVPPRRALLGAVPMDKQGQASGVNLTIQMLGGTVGMALCGTLLVATGDYGILFFVTGGLVFATLIATWFMIERPAASDS